MDQLIAYDAALIDDISRPRRDALLFNIDIVELSYSAVHI